MPILGLNDIRGHHTLQQHHDARATPHPHALHASLARADCASGSASPAEVSHGENYTSREASPLSAAAQASSVVSSGGAEEWEGGVRGCRGDASTVSPFRLRHGRGGRTG
jgi:hypothetical protein